MILLLLFLSALTPPNSWAKGDTCRRCNFMGTRRINGTGTFTCDKVTGKCNCLPNVEGKYCDRCTRNHWKFPSMLGCEPCDCDPNRSHGCDDYTGKCECNYPYKGDLCDMVDGRWSSWSEFGPCSATCGSSTKRRERTCSNPAPENGGKMCKGQNYQVTDCSTQDCPNCIVEKSCSECLSTPNCKWCKEPGYSEPRCNDDHNFQASPCASNEIIDQVSNMTIVEDSELAWNNQMRPEHVHFSLRPNEERSINISFTAITNRITMLSDASEDISVTFKTSCNNKKSQTEGYSCSGLYNAARVIFTADIKVVNCPRNKNKTKQSFEIFTESYSSSERMTVDVDLLCGCKCELSGNNKNECPAPVDKCNAKASCAKCLEDSRCAWRKSEQVSSEGSSVPHCISNEDLAVSEDITNPHGNVEVTQNTPLNMMPEDVFFQPQKLSISLRPGKPQVINFLWGKLQPSYDRFRVEMGDNAPDYLEVNYTTSCMDKFPKQQRTTCPELWMGTNEYCTDKWDSEKWKSVRICTPENNTVEFQATVELLKCPLHPKDWNQTLKISPVNEYTQAIWKQKDAIIPLGFKYQTTYDWVQGLDATLDIDLTLLCQECDCQKEYEEYTPQCSEHGIYTCGGCHCHHGRSGLNCEIEERFEKGSYIPSPTCLLNLRKPDNGVWTCLNENGVEGCQLVCPPGFVEKSGSFIHCDGSTWSQDPEEFSCVLAATLMVGSGNNWGTLRSGSSVEAYGKQCELKLVNVPNMLLYGHTIDLFDGKVIMCGGGQNMGFWFLNKCQYLRDIETYKNWRPMMSGISSKHEKVFVHYSTTNEERSKHASLVIKDRLYLIGGENSPNTTEYLSLTKETRSEKWMIGCGEPKVTATQENLEEILDFLDRKLGSFGILTVENGQVLGRSYGGIINETVGDGHFHLLESISDKENIGPSFEVLTSDAYAGEGDREDFTLMGVYHESCKTHSVPSRVLNETCGNSYSCYYNGEVDRPTYIKPKTEDSPQLFLYLNREHKWVVGTDLTPEGVLMASTRDYNILIKYKDDSWLWRELINGKWETNEDISFLPHEEHATWNKGLDLGLNFTNACAIKSGVDTFLAIGVGDMSQNVMEYNVTDGSRRKLGAQLKIGRSGHECVYVEHNNKRLIVIAGGTSDGGDGGTSDGYTPLGSTEILDLDSETMEEAGDMVYARRDFIMYLSGGVVEASRWAWNGYYSSFKNTDEVFDVETKAWKLTSGKSKRTYKGSSGLEGSAATGVPFSKVGFWKEC